MTKPRIAAFGLGLGVILLLTAGCKTTRLAEPVAGPGYQPANVYQNFRHLPADLRRVAVLPATSEATSAAAAGSDTLGPIIAEELGKTRKFELIIVTPAQLRAWTGRAHWRAEEELPADFLRVLQAQLGCDGVLFTRITQFRPYPPLAVGLSLKLAEASTGDLIWATDEVFDASEPAVVNSARRYQQTREQLPASLADSRSILNSPSTFGRFAAGSVLTTLPAR